MEIEKSGVKNSESDIYGNTGVFGRDIGGTGAGGA